jgi:hypothetical protein
MVSIIISVVGYMLLWHFSKPHAVVSYDIRNGEITVKQDWTSNYINALNIDINNNKYNIITNNHSEVGIKWVSPNGITKGDKLRIHGTIQFDRIAPCITEFCEEIIVK